MPIKKLTKSTAKLIWNTKPKAIRLPKKVELKTIEVMFSREAI